MRLKDGEVEGSCLTLFRSEFTQLKLGKENEGDPQEEGSKGYSESKMGTTG